jgi:CheY-like chemotaxis protein
LVVEDDPGTRATLTQVLTGAGAEVREASSGAAALNVLDEFEPDALVCDIALPQEQEDGCFLLRQISARGSGRRKLRALALTAFAGEKDRERTRAAGFEKHLVKPVGVQELVDAVADVLPRSRRTHGALRSV